jgi:hypothetical protein
MVASYPGLQVLTQVNKMLMKNIVITTALFLFVLWAVIFLGFQVGGVVHFLLVLVLACLMVLMAGRKKKYGDHTIQINK